MRALLYEVSMLTTLKQLAIMLLIAWSIVSIHIIADMKFKLNALEAQYVELQLKVERVNTWIEELANEL